MFKRFAPYILLLLLLYPIVQPMYSKTILGSADNLAHLFRVVNLDAALREGYLWPRWAGLAGHGYGAPIFNFNYMLPYYFVIAIWRVCGSLIHASQWYMIATILGSSLAMYASIASIFSVPAALVAAVAYAYIPYHLMTIYLYGGYGEALAFVWVPLLFTFFFKLITHPRNLVHYIWSIFFLSLLILSHNLSALMALPLIGTLVFVVPNSRMIEGIKRLLIVCASSALLTCWFWLPSLMEERFTKLSVLFEKETGLRGYFFQMIAPVWENSLRALQFTAPGYYSYAIGVPTILVVIIGIIFLLRPKKPQRIDAVQNQRFGVYFLIWCVASFVMTRQVSEPIWHLLPAQMNFLSYPYRFFFISTFATAGLTGYLVHEIYKFKIQKIETIVTLCIVGLFMWQGIVYAHPNIDTFGFGEEYFTYSQTVREAPYTHKNMGYIEFIPRSANSDFVNALDSQTMQSQRAEFLNGSGTLHIKSQKAQELTLAIQAQEASRIQINILYFPGWIGKIGTTTYMPQVDANGRMIFSVPKGTYDMHVIFANTFIRTFAIALSIISFSVFICFIAYTCVKSMKSHLRV